MLRANERKAEINNKTGFALAYMMDDTEEEQERGVTIEVATRYFSTPNRNFTILDAPGHRDFIANMITGAAQMDGAILVCGATDGPMPQTREHILLCRQVGVKTIIVFLNKCD